MAHKQTSEFNSASLAEFLKKEKIWFKLHEFEEDVKTAEKASRQVPQEKIIKSLVFMDSNQEPFIVIIQANKKVDFKKVKKVLGVKDVRLASAKEVLENSGYAVGAVPPIFYKNVKRVIVDAKTTKIDVVFAGGGDVNKLIEMKMEDIIKLNNAIIEDISE